MIALRRIERAARLDSGDDRLLEPVRLIELGDVGLGDVRLLGVGWEDRRAILGAGIRALPVELSGIVHDREENLEHPPIADLRAGSNVTCTDSACPVVPVLTISYAPFSCRRRHIQRRRW